MIRGEPGLGDYLPPFLKNQNIVPTDCELRVKNDADGKRRHFVYSVSWIVEHPPSTTPPTLHSQSRQSLRTTSSSSKLSTISNNSLAQTKRVCKSNCDGPTGSARCDGPCQKYRPQEELDIRGRCGHFLCKCCTKLTKNLDSSFGCSAFECVYAHIFDKMSVEEARSHYDNFIKKRARENEESMLAAHTIVPAIPEPASVKKATASSRGDQNFGNSFRHIRLRDASKKMTNARNHINLPELRSVNGSSKLKKVDVHLMVIVNKNGKPCKDELSMSMNTDTSLLDAIEALVDGKPEYSGDGDVFYGYPGNLKYIAPFEIESAKLADFPVNWGALEFVFDKIGYLSSKAGHS